MASLLALELPIEDRRRSFDFYRAALGLETVGETGSDGLPEPLQFEVSEGLRLMLIPTVGFGWVTGNREVAPRDLSECLLGLERATEAEVDDAIDRARRAGAEIVMEPTRKPWAYFGVFADPDGHLWMATVPA